MRHHTVGLGMKNGSLTQVQVTKQPKIWPRTLNRWMALDHREETLQDRRSRGRRTAISRVTKKSWRSLR